MFDECDNEVSNLFEAVSDELLEISNSYVGTVPLFNKGAIYSHLTSPDELYSLIMGDIKDIPFVAYYIPISNTVKENQLKISNFLEKIEQLETVSLLEKYPLTEDESEDDNENTSTHFFELLISQYDPGGNTQDAKVTKKISDDGDDVIVIGSYTRAERRRKIQRYREKRKRRHLKKKVYYACRQRFARERPRVGGRFVKKGYVPPKQA